MKLVPFKPGKKNNAGEDVTALFSFSSFLQCGRQLTTKKINVAKVFFFSCHSRNALVENTRFEGHVVQSQRWFEIICIWHSSKVDTRLPLGCCIQAMFCLLKPDLSFFALPMNHEKRPWKSLHPTVQNFFLHLCYNAWYLYL